MNEVIILKIAGAVLILAASSFLGLYLGTVNKLRIKRLRELENSWTLAAGEIRFGISSLPEVFRNIAVQNRDEYIKNFYETMYKSMASLDTKEGFDVLWEKAVREKLSGNCLTGDDCRLVAEFGSIPLHPDTAMQLQFIERLVQQLETVINQAQDEISVKCRIYRCVGVAAGIFLVLVLI